VRVLRATIESGASGPRLLLSTTEGDQTFDLTLERLTMMEAGALMFRNRLLGHTGGVLFEDQVRFEPVRLTDMVPLADAGDTAKV
jgi:hypothetical protein